MLLVAEPDTQDYLVAIKETMARVGEINRLTWEDVDFERDMWCFIPGKRKAAT